MIPVIVADLGIEISNSNRYSLYRWRPAIFLVGKRMKISQCDAGLVEGKSISKLVPSTNEDFALMAPP